MADLQQLATYTDLIFSQIGSGRVRSMANLLSFVNFFKHYTNDVAMQ